MNPSIHHIIIFLPAGVRRGRSKAGKGNAYESSPLPLESPDMNQVKSTKGSKSKTPVVVATDSESLGVRRGRSKAILAACEGEGKLYESF